MVHLQKRENNLIIYELDGELAGSSMNQWEQKFDVVFSDNTVDKVILNLQKVTFIQSSGVGMIVAIFKVLEEREGKMIVCHLSEENKDLFQMTRLNEIITIKETQEEALAEINNP